MSVDDVDAWLRKLGKDKRETLEKVRKALRAALPDATEGIGYGMPAFFKGKPIAGYSASDRHCSYHPMSGRIIETLKDELKDYETSKGTIRFPVGSSLPSSLIRKLVKARLAEVEGVHANGSATRYVALLRAVNVGGTGKLSMADLKALCRKAGFLNVETYIASGNVVFESADPAAQVKAKLENQLLGLTGKPVSVVVRTAAEMKAILKNNPFPQKQPNFTAVFFLDKKPADVLKGITGQVDEKVTPGKREIYVYYPTGMGRSKLKIQAAKDGTARNINTVAKLVEMVTVSNV